MGRLTPCKKERVKSAHRCTASSVGRGIRMSRRSKIAGESRPYDMTCCALAHTRRFHALPCCLSATRHITHCMTAKSRHMSCHSNHTAAYEELPHRLSWDCLRSYHMTPSEPLNDLYHIPSGLRLCTGLSVLPLLTSHHLLELR